MSITFNTNIPQPGDNPSVSQGQFLTNFNAIQSIWGVDHVNFNVGAGSVSGQHQLVTFNGKNVPGTQTDPNSALYTNNVTSGSFNTASASTVAEMYYKNNSAIFPISMIKAFGCFDNNGNSLNAWNMVLHSPGGHPSAGMFSFDMPSNCCTGTSYAVFCSAMVNATSRLPFIILYGINSPTNFFVNFQTQNSGFQDPQQFSVLVMQL